MTKLNIPQVKISTYNKTANGVVERGNFTLREAIIQVLQSTHRLAQESRNCHLADRISISGVTGFFSSLFTAWSTSCPPI